MDTNLVALAKELLRRHNVRIKKKLGQHFVVNKRLIDEIVENVLAIKPNYVVEIGTGLGFLTMYLSDIVKNVVSVEIDRKLAEVARKLLKERHGVNLVISDGVEFIKTALRVPYAIVSNVPYNITGPLLIALIKSNCTSAILTLQDEVANRLVASPGSKNYSRISVMVNTFMDVKLGSKYSPESFYPTPKISSRIVILRRVREWGVTWNTYEALIKCMFNQKRKLAKKVLNKCISELDLNLSIDDALRLLGDKRVYELPVNTFIKIFTQYLDCKS